MKAAKIIYIHRTKHNMKKLLLLMIISLMCISTYAQDVNKTFLTGKWIISSMSSDEFTFHKDSLAQDLQNIYNKAAGGKNVNMSSKDSLTMMNSLMPVLTDLFKTTAKFDADGHYEMQMNILRKGSKEKGTYSWTNSNVLVTKSGKKKTSTYIITSLTAKRLVMTTDFAKGDKDYLEMIFSKE